ncbi:conserved unknown protein [Ectocarpus siliculosus]|uniref:Uncharacterized protein n=1 Tax=Ectocarpus siliculosus TaxID=2880 RepID=D7FWE0_ECTSI|nr:conserved unknown protein [Ectocarpus siliculosus]|eukprot:CBJ32028.1 conserved unknown protein [Ectocarpus siliculosus]
MGLRKGSEEAIRLMDSDNKVEWEATFQSYSASVKRLSQEKGKSELVELDQWWRTELPAALVSRGATPYLLKDELVKVVQWKLWIGQMRPSLLQRAKETSPSTVKAKSTLAFQQLPRPSLPSSPTAAARASPEAVSRAVNALTKDLYGVGPATASAVLAAGCGGCPFDADEVIDAVKRSGKRQYSLKEYLEVHEALDQKAVSLGTPWDAERVRKALWSCAMHSRFGMTVPPVPTGATAASPQETATAAAAAGGRGDGDKPRARKSGSGGGADGAEAATKKQKSRPH